MTVKFIVNRGALRPYLCKNQHVKGGPVGRGTTPGKALKNLKAKLKILSFANLSVGEVIYL